MTTLTPNLAVCALQGELGLAMVKRPYRPSSRVMTSFAAHA